MIRYLLILTCLFFNLSCVEKDSYDDHNKDSNLISVNEDNPRYFVNKKNETWIPIMINYLPFEINNDEEKGLQEIEHYFKSFSENGGNSMRIWISTPFLEIEDSTEGHYNPQKFARIDRMLEIAEKYSILIKFTLHHIRSIDPASKAWHNNPALSTKFNNIEEYISTFEGRESYLKRAKAFSDRYKDSKQILGWELWNEMNAVGQDGSWVDFTVSVIDSLKKLFPNHSVTQTIGSLDSDYSLKHYQKLIELKINDFLPFHRYLDIGAQYEIVKGPIDELSADLTNVGLNLTNNALPVVVNEIGAVEANHAGPFKLYRKDTLGVLIHDMLFAPYFSGAAGPGAMWHWNDYVNANNLWFHYRIFNNAVKKTDPIKDGFLPQHFESDGIRYYILKGKNKSLIWCRDTQSNWRSELENDIPAKIKTNVSFSLSYLGDNYSSFTFYEPWEDIWHSKEEIKNNTITLPPFVRSAVILLER